MNQRKFAKFALIAIVFGFALMIAPAAFAQSEGLGRVMASGVIASVPVVVLFLIFQRFVVRGIAMSSGK